jgi:hypothetical protein
VKSEFDRYIGVVPASRIDLDGLAERARDSRRRRLLARAGILAVALTTAVAAGGLAIAGQHRAANAPAGPSATASPSPSPSTASDEVTAARLLTVLKAAISAHAPGVGGLDTVTRRYLPCTSHAVATQPPTPSVSCEPGADPGGPLHSNRDIYLWQGQLTSATGSFVVYVSIGRSVYYDPSAPPINQEDADERAAAVAHGNAPQRGAGGENILVTPGFLHLTKPDGTTIMISCFAAKVISDRLFTRDQLIAIGLTPDLRL